MVRRELSIADLILIAGTRVALGAGIGLLVANRLNYDQRKAAGLVLALIGGLSTIPLSMIVANSKPQSERLRVAA
jgi:hypothetical protein